MRMTYKLYPNQSIKINRPRSQNKSPAQSNCGLVMNIPESAIEIYLLFNIVVYRIENAGRRQTSIWNTSELGGDKRHA
jgi:hypothetical protein